jgi:hypothetical protein
MTCTPLHSALEDREDFLRMTIRLKLVFYSLITYEPRRFISMNKKQGSAANHVCSQCGGTLDLATGKCLFCGATAPEQPSEKYDEPLRGLKVALTVVASILLMISSVLFVIILLFRALSSNITLAAIGALSAGRLTAFFNSWSSLAVGLGLVILHLMLLVLINNRRIRRAFLASGVVALLTAGVCLGMGIAVPKLIHVLSGGWQDVLVGVTRVVRDFAFVYAVFMIGIGATCLSIFSCIAVTRRPADKESSSQLPEPTIASS